MIDVTNKTLMSAVVVDGNVRDTALLKFNALTPREREVAVRIARGERQSFMARQMGISAKTVQTHREKAMMSLGVRSNQGVAVLAYMAGLITAP